MSCIVRSNKLKWNFSEVTCTHCEQNMCAGYRSSYIFAMVRSAVLFADAFPSLEPDSILFQSLVTTTGSILLQNKSKFSTNELGAERYLPNQEFPGSLGAILCYLPTMVACVLD